MPVVIRMTMKAAQVVDMSVSEAKGLQGNPQAARASLIVVSGPVNDGRSQAVCSLFV
jgi:hypothetical protein